MVIVRSSIFLICSALWVPMASHATGRVMATANGATQEFIGPTETFAGQTIGAYSASTFRFSQTVTGSSRNFFRDAEVRADAVATSDYTVVGIAVGTPLTFNWAFTGSRSWDVDNAGFGGGLKVEWSGAGFIHNFGWGISYIDGPPAFGDFAGVLQAELLVAEAGGNLPLTTGLPSPWNGQGLMNVQSLWTANPGATGTITLRSGIGMSGTLDASYSLRLVSITVPSELWLPGPAFLELDSGEQFPISAVPEPSVWLLMLFGLGVAAAVRHRRG